MPSLYNLFNMTFSKVYQSIGEKDKAKHIRDQGVDELINRKVKSH